MNLLGNKDTLHSIESQWVGLEQKKSVDEYFCIQLFNISFFHYRKQVATPPLASTPGIVPRDVPSVPKAART